MNLNVYRVYQYKLNHAVLTKFPVTTVRIQCSPSHSMLTKWFSLYVEFHNIHQVTNADQVQDYLEVISMDRASMSTKCMMMSSIDSGCWVSEPHRVSLHNPSFWSMSRLCNICANLYYGWLCNCVIGLVYMQCFVSHPKCVIFKKWKECN